MPKRPKVVTSLMQVPRLGRHVKRAHDGWLRRRCEQYWASESSPARRRYQESPPVLNPIQQRILTDWNDRGVAYATYDELIGDPGLWSQMDAELDGWAHGSTVRQKERDYVEGGYRNSVFKEYLVKYYGYDEARVVPWSSPFLRMGVHTKLLDVVNGYMQMHALLRYLDAWYTMPLSHGRTLTGSQCWHRDPEDVKIAKVFLYFSDVPVEAGALEYIPHSRAGEKYGDLGPHRVPSGSRPPQEKVDATVAPGDIERCAKPRGTFVFVDTTGLHRGGDARTQPRLFACWEYVSPVAPFPRSFLPGRPPKVDSVPPSVHDALPGWR
ncbi:MAG: hypothetical protein ACO1SX_03410 [Actinomycetota bacterium]